MMDVSILCPGPSVELYDRNHESDRGRSYIMAVNRAILFESSTFNFKKVDLWCILDWVFYRKMIAEVDVSCDLLTSHASLSQLSRQSIKHNGKVNLVDDVTDPDPSQKIDVRGSPGKQFVFNWRLFTVTSAIVWAYHLGAKQITLFGADMVGAQDWDGYSDELYVRDENRWVNSEQTLIESLSDWLASRGVTLCRLIRV